MEYQSIFTIKKSEKATVELADVEGIKVPAIVKRLRGAKPDIYRLLCHAQNSHIPQVYTCEQQGDELVVVEEYVDGENLEEYLEKQQFGDAAKLELALQLCEAVEFLHGMVPPIIHRDIKPSNIVITGKGVLKLIDFDASRQYKEFRNSGDTRLLGTVEYAPPEQFGYSQTDVRSDIYSMGVVFHGFELSENKKQMEQWSKIVERCTSFDPKNRYQSVPELKKEIEKLKDRKKIKWRKITVTAGIVVAIACTVTTLAFGMRQKQNRDAGGELSYLTGTPVPSPSPSPTATVSPSPSPSPTATVSPSPSPSPTATVSPSPSPSPTATVSPSPSPSPTATVSPTPVPSPTSTVTVSPMPSPTPTALPDMPQIISNMVNNVKVPDKIPDPAYKYYQAEAERTELIFGNAMAELDVTLLGGACYQFETKEWIYIPIEMIYGDPAYYGVSDEFMLGLDPGIYHFCIFRGNESGQRVRISTSVEVHSKEEKIDRPENLLTETELTFYSDFSKDMAVVLYSDVQSKITGVEMWNQNAEAEPVDSSLYEIVCDGKVLLIKEELLVKYLDKESITFSVILADGQSQNIKVVMEKGLPSMVSPTPVPSPTATLTPTPSASLTATPVPTMTEQMKMMSQYLITPSEISSSPHNYYKSAAEDMELIHAYDIDGLDVTFLGGMCYQYETKEYIYIPGELIDGGPTYYRIADEFVMGLKPGLYHIYVARENETGKTGFMGRSLHVHGEEESVQESEELLAYTTREFYSEYQRDVDFTVKCGVLARISGFYMVNSDSESEPVDVHYYEIILDGKGLLIKKEFLASHLEKASLRFAVVFDDGQTQEVEVKLLEGVHPKVMPTPTLTPAPTLTPIPTPTPVLSPIPTSYNQHYYKSLVEETELILRHGSDTSRLPETWDGECYDYFTGKTYYIPMDEIEIGPGYIRLLDGGMDQLEPSTYNLTINMYGANGWYQSTSRVTKVYSKNEYPNATSGPMANSTNYFYREEPHDFVKDVLSFSTSRFVGVYAEIPGTEAVEVPSEQYEILCDGKVMIIKKEFLQQYYETGQKINLIYHFDDGKQQTMVINYEESR